MRFPQKTPTRRTAAHPTQRRWPLTSRLPALLGAAVLAGGGLALAAGPARADCAADLQVLDAQMVAAETGTAAGGEMPATEHQEEVLAGNEAPMETAAGDVPATTPHQRQVLDLDVMAGLDSEDRSQVDLLIAEARAAAQAGDEQACSARLNEARDIIRGS